MPIVISWKRLAQAHVVCLLLTQPGVEAFGADNCRNPGGLPKGFPAVEAGMVFVPGGSFTMGSEDYYPEEGPALEASVEPFFMDAYEVTNAEFAAFVRATNYVTDAEKPLPPESYAGLPAEYRVPGSLVFIMPQAALARMDPRAWFKFTPGANWRHPQGPGSSSVGHDNEPVTNISYADALAYAQWRGHDLPSEAEWEWAARGGGMLSSAAMQNETDANPNANIWQGVFPFYDSAADGFHGVAPGGCFPPNGFGLFDMIGNVWEWTSDLYSSRHDADPAVTNPQLRVIKGGSWLCATSFCGRFRPSARQPEECNLGSTHIGFRTIWRAPTPAE